VKSTPSTLSRRSFASRAAGFATAPFLASWPIVQSASGATARPNILFIMTDDHSSHAISCYGSKVNQTPNLDRLAKEGIRMDRVFATNSICTPSRSAARSR